MAVRSCRDTTSSLCCNTNREGDCSRPSPNSTSISGSCTNASTAFTSCGRSSKPSAWPTRIEIDFEFAKRTQIDLSSSIEIEDNLVVRSAKLILDRLKVKAQVRFVLLKQIPMGAGLGGGSSNAAAVLIALPALSGRPLRLPELVRLAEIPGQRRALLPARRHRPRLGAGHGSLPAPGPAGAGCPGRLYRYSRLHGRGLQCSRERCYERVDFTAESPILREFQTVAWSLASQDRSLPLFKNDFEQAVFRQHPLSREDRR